MDSIQIEEKDKLGFMPRWDLSDLYKSPQDSALEDDIKKLEKNIKSFSEEYQGKIDKLSANELHKAMIKYENMTHNLLVL